MRASRTVWSGRAGLGGLGGRNGGLHWAGQRRKWYDFQPEFQHEFQREFQRESQSPSRSFKAGPRTVRQSVSTTSTEFSRTNETFIDGVVGLLARCFFRLLTRAVHKDSRRAGIESKQRKETTKNDHEKRRVRPPSPVKPNR